VKNLTKKEMLTGGSAFWIHNAEQAIEVDFGCYFAGQILGITGEAIFEKLNLDLSVNESKLCIYTGSFIYLYQYVYLYI